MKKLLLIVLFISSQFSFSQGYPGEEENIKNLIQIWGLLKYQHPDVSRGKYNINDEFFNQLEKLKSTDRQEFDSQLLAWVKSFVTGDLKRENKSKTKQKLFSKNADFEWIVQSGFGEELEGLLQKISVNANYGEHYASVNRWSSSVVFVNDAAIKDFDSKNKAHRLLFLAHFWNAMKYWNVNIYLTNTAWAEVLPEMITEFSKEDPDAFELAKEKLFSKLNDSHANYLYSHTLNSLTHYPNFGGRIINDSLVVTRIFDKDSIKQNAVSPGDIIYSVEGEKLKKYYTDKFSRVISVSNENHLKNEVQNSYLLASDKDSIRVGVFKKNGVKVEQFIPLNKLKYPYEKYERKHPEKTVNWKMLSEDIGYMNLYEITKDEVDAAFHKFEGAKGIIIDLRNYPRNISPESLPKYLYPLKKRFVKTLTSERPGYGNPDTKTALKFISNPFAAGKRNRKYYKGKVILLVDRSTLSKAEWIGMAIQASPNVITVGEQTGGAVLNRNKIKLMDNTSIDFTMATAFYPQGEEVQRNGLKLDYEIQESAINYNKELYIKTAVDIIEEKSLPLLN